MSTLGYIILLIFIVLLALIKKENIKRWRWILDPIVGVGLVLIALGNFITGEMIGNRRIYNMLNSYSIRELWTIESHPFQFITVNIVILILGIGLIGWRLIRR